MRHLLIALVLLTATPATGENRVCALGHCKGDQLSEYAEKNAVGLNQEYKKHPLFEELIIQGTPATGVCRILGFYVVEGSDRFCTLQREALDRFSGYVETKYGEPTARHDFLRQDALWTEARDCEWSLRDDERLMFNHWDKPAEGIRSIEVAVVSETLVKVAYFFGNWDQCVEAARSDVANDF